MSMQEIKRSLDIRPIGVQHVDQSADLLTYVFQVTNQDLAQIRGQSPNDWKKPVLEQCDGLGWFSGEKLISQLVVYPFSVNIHGKNFKMGGVTGVGTYPEYAGLGLMNDLMKQSLQKMRESGQTISYLYPYSIPYYRKKGWEIISDVITYKVRDTQIPKSYEVKGRMERVKWDHSDIKQTYSDFSKKENAAMIRNELAWDEHFRWERDDLSACVYYDEAHRPTGYMYYKVENETFYVREMIFNNEDARRGLWNFIGAHFSMVYYVEGKIFQNEPLSFFLDDGEIEEKISPYYMARLVDAKQFLLDFPFTKQVDEGLTIHLTDPMLEWNNGTFSFEWNTTKDISEADKTQHHVIELDVQTLCTMLLNYKRASNLKEVGRLTASEETIQYLERIIPDNEPWFSDYF
ncbi:GNAT family N-acetyltransferase [Alkalicoccobacillus murimartini]|nr:GNAT family N-acetyltransferase [Alkalicoccobacillus murimartini]